VDSIFQWLPKSRNMMTIPIQNTHNKNILHFYADYAITKKQGYKAGQSVMCTPFFIVVAAQIKKKYDHSYSKVSEQELLPILLLLV
jgi:hypothetical protein